MWGRLNACPVHISSKEEMKCLKQLSDHMKKRWSAVLFWRFLAIHIRGALTLRESNGFPKVYSDLTDKEEASLFANQTGFGVPPSIGMKLRARVFAGDPEACGFLKATEQVGLRIDYGQHKGRKRLACIAAALTEYRKLGPEKYQEAMKMILDGWDGDPDSLRAETVTGVCRFVDLYRGEYDPKRAVKRFRTVDPLKIYRDGKAMGDNLPGYKKYLYQVLMIYNGASKKAALPMKF